MPEPKPDTSPPSPSSPTAQSSSPERGYHGVKANSSDGNTTNDHDITGCNLNIHINFCNPNPAPNNDVNIEGSAATTQPSIQAGNPDGASTTTGAMTNPELDHDVNGHSSTAGTQRPIQTRNPDGSLTIPGAITIPGTVTSPGAIAGPKAITHPEPDHNFKGDSSPGDTQPAIQTGNPDGAVASPGAIASSEPDHTANSDSSPSGTATLSPARDISDLAEQAASSPSPATASSPPRRPLPEAPTPAIIHHTTITDTLPADAAEAERHRQWQEQHRRVQLERRRQDGPFMNPQVAAAIPRVYQRREYDSPDGKYTAV
ncbi:hypothetical protein C8A05DRAFT_35539 [Staphylotrichum tortipilum]|uniref:Uncharacterized protein n=1 Tax=Staphylotrichum tortipilum TaxID=2831512 RepID=A0AAN6MHR4_9PEZI|nr:hypothetical protein C8A05DRAFT_35539 [Staphylotrichum longicolle]